MSALIALLQYFDLETQFYPWFNIAPPGQAFGNLRQPNQLASLLVIGALALRWWVQVGRVPLGAAVALGALLMAALAATASRVGLVALLVCGGLAAWWALQAGRGWRAVLAVGGAVALYVLAALVLPGLAQMTEGVAGRDMLERLRTAESTCGSRLILWNNVLHLISLKPWTGWGWGELDYAHYMTRYDGARFCHILDNAHNLPLHLAVELGVPVALAACAAAGWLVWRGRPWAEQHPARQLAWGVLAVISIHSLVEYPLWYGPFQIAVAVCVWLLWATRRGKLVEEVPPGLRTARYPLAAAMLAATAYAGWDYHRISQIYVPVEQRSAMYGVDAMKHAQKSRLYADVVRFAEVTTRPAVRDNAGWMLPAALQTLHFSPEPRVITKVIESATLLGQDDLALAHLARFRAAFPKEHAKWVQDNAKVLEGARQQLQGASSQ
ncbi:MAG: Wzy polymerase domain-containing protein [Pseudomonadota bacterium]|nr:Wzy polymerase domain-containing protein [Pseudomonadota bacterium]